MKTGIRAFLALVALSFGSAAFAADDHVSSLASVRKEEPIKLKPFIVGGKEVNVNDVPDDANVLTFTNYSNYPVRVMVGGIPSALNDISDQSKKRWVMRGGGSWTLKKNIFQSGRMINVKIVFIYSPQRVWVTEKTFDLGKQFDKNGNWIKGEKWSIGHRDLNQVSEQEALKIAAAFKDAERVWKLANASLVAQTGP